MSSQDGLLQKKKPADYFEKDAAQGRKCLLHLLEVAKLRGD
jgi:hypothetical protein